MPKVKAADLAVFDSGRKGEDLGERMGGAISRQFIHGTSTISRQILRMALVNRRDTCARPCDLFALRSQRRTRMTPKIPDCTEQVPFNININIECASSIHA